jgi:hypothetical protein
MLGAAFSALIVPLFLLAQLASGGKGLTTHAVATALGSGWHRNRMPEALMTPLVLFPRKTPPHCIHKAGSPAKQRHRVPRPQKAVPDLPRSRTEDRCHPERHPAFHTLASSGSWRK